MNKILFTVAIALTTVSFAQAQVPTSVAIQILKAEDARRYDAVLENLMKSPNAAVRERAALAAGRIGGDKAISVLTSLLEKEQSEEVRAMAAFALGEIESIQAANAVLSWLPNLEGFNVKADLITPRITPIVISRLVEAAGKIAAANPKDPKAKELGTAILNVLDVELKKRAAPSVDVIRFGLTAVLRAKPDGADEIIQKFLAFTDPDVVGDALNTLARLRAKNANRDARDLLETSVHALIRANAARLLGVAEDKDAFDALLKAATTDKDSRVRVSAIRALGSLKDAKAADRLIDRGNLLITAYKASKFHQPVEQNELIEIATVLGRLLAGTSNARAVKLLGDLAMLDDARNPEFSVARMRVHPDEFDNTKRTNMTWREMITTAQAVAELATIDPKTDEAKKMKAEAPDVLQAVLELFSEPGVGDDKLSVYAIPDYLQAFTKFKPANLSEVLRASLGKSDVQIRATAAGLLADQPSSKESVEVLKTAFDSALVKDKDSNDAQLAILDALYKLDKKESVGTLLVALSAPDYLVRKKAFELLADKDLQKDLPGIPTSLENARAKHKDQVLPYSPTFGTKQGQILNTDAEYRRAVLRKNGTVRAVLTTQKGTFTIDFSPEDAPLTVDNFVKLARSGYFNGLEVHRVVPNFVMQDGDPRGDGNGGPGWSIRCEINMLPYDRGAVGMALSGKDTGGSQWFVTHSPQPHLDGGYTVFGHVNETGMKVVDNIVRGDKIISVKIIEGNSPKRTHRSPSKK